MRILRTVTFCEALALCNFAVALSLACVGEPIAASCNLIVGIILLNLSE